MIELAVAAAVVVVVVVVVSLIREREREREFFTSLLHRITNRKKQANCPKKLYRWANDTTVTNKSITSLRI